MYLGVSGRQDAGTAHPGPLGLAGANSGRGQGEKIAGVGILGGRQDSPLQVGEFLGGAAGLKTTQDGGVGAMVDGGEFRGGAMKAFLDDKKFKPGLDTYDGEN